MGDIHNLKREMLVLRRCVWPVREVVSGLQRAESRHEADGEDPPGAGGEQLRIVRPENRRSRQLVMIGAMAAALEEARLVWLRNLPSLVAQITTRWSLTVECRLSAIDAGCAWVASVTNRDGANAVLKVGFPHFEEEHEIQGLRFWDGEPTVRLLAADEESA